MKRDTVIPRGELVHRLIGLSQETVKWKFVKHNETGLRGEGEGFRRRVSEII